MSLTIIDVHRQRWENCMLCDIGRTANKHVFYRGTIPCDVLFIGEGPGVTEDAEGRPFVGKSGKILDAWIAEAFNDWTGKACTKCKGTGEGSLDYPRDCQSCAGTGEEFGSTATFAITNLVCCRPLSPEKADRPPTRIEIANCYPRLLEFVGMAKPKGVVFLGKVPADRCQVTFSVPRLSMYHPSYILRNGGEGSKPYVTQCDMLKQFVRGIVKQHLLRK